MHYLLSPTLALLKNSQSVSIAFAPSLPALRAYLSNYHPQESTMTADSEASGKCRPILALLNPLSVHRPTGSFSAQGISRTIAGAVEAAHRARQQLVIVECADSWLPEGSGEDDDEFDEAEADVTMHDGQAEGPEGPNRLADPWDEMVPILSTTLRLSGSGERSWVGRSVKVRQIAARWCSFEDA